MELRLGGRPIGLLILTILRSKKAARACSYNARSAQEKNPSAGRWGGTPRAEDGANESKERLDVFFSCEDSSLQ